MKAKVGEEFVVKIDSLAFEGAGVCSVYEGFRVFVANTMPGDKVKIVIKQAKRRYAYAEVVEYIEKAKGRIKPDCKHFDSCGGCQFQFLPYEKQLEYKRGHVLDCFERIAKLKGLDIPEVLPSKQKYHYRNKVEFSFGYDAEMKFCLGMHVPNRRFDILDIKECLIGPEESVEILGVAKKFVTKYDLKPYKFSCNEGLLRSLFIRKSIKNNTLMINLTSSQHIHESFESELKAFVEMLLNIEFESSAKIVSIYWTQIHTQRGKPRKEIEKHLYGEKSLEESLEINGQKLDFDIFPSSFFQVNTMQAEVLYAEILKLLDAEEQGTVFDLYCGTGTISLFMAKQSKNVIGIELNEDSVKAARANAAKNKILNIDFYSGDVYKKLLALRAPHSPSTIVVDPPRAGLSPKAISKISEFSANKIIYVSCNPATLARDLADLKDYGYAIKSVQAVDMFPHTYHIETVCLLEKIK